MVTSVHLSAYKSTNQTQIVKEISKFYPGYLHLKGTDSPHRLSGSDSVLLRVLFVGFSNILCVDLSPTLIIMTPEQCEGMMDGIMEGASLGGDTGHWPGQGGHSLRVPVE